MEFFFKSMDTIFPLLPLTFPSLLSPPLVTVILPIRSLFLFSLKLKKLFLLPLHFLFSSKCYPLPRTLLFLVLSYSSLFQFVLLGKKEGKWEGMRTGMTTRVGIVWGKNGNRGGEVECPNFLQMQDENIYLTLGTPTWSRTRYSSARIFWASPASCSWASGKQKNGKV